MLKNKKGYVLIEVSVFIVIISMLCASLTMVISNKININKVAHKKDSLGSFFLFFRDL